MPRDKSSPAPVETGWTLGEAILFLRDLENVVRPVGYHVGLTGGVLYGGTGKDLDVLLYPASSDRKDEAAVKAALERYGMSLIVGRDIVTKRWRKLGSTDTKHVEVWAFKDQRVDLFFVE